MIKAEKNINNKINGIQRFTLPVEGMTCASCVARVEKSIKKVDGVSNVSVNLANEKATFQFDPSKVDIKDISKQIEGAGYKLDTSLLDKNSKIIEEKNEISHFHKELTKELIIAIILTIPILILNMGTMWEGFHKILPLSNDYINKILLLLTTPVVFISGKRFFKIFWKNLKHFYADMNSLVAVGTGAAFAFSTLVTLFPNLILNHEQSPHVYFDTAAVIITLILLGRWLESRAKSKANSSVKKLLGLKPKTALVKKDGKEFQVNIDELKIGDIVIIKPGGKIPADGKIISGKSILDESMITGESIPVEKSIGSKVIGGTINKTGSFEFKITAIGEDSVLGQIIKMVEEAQGSKAPIQNLADKVAAVFVPVVIGISIITFIIWLIIGAQFSLALINFVAVLIIACPCALGLATPTAIIVGTGKSAQLGILIKNGKSLELAHKISTVIFDKTGTITEGKPHVSQIITNNLSKEKLIQIAASIENKSEHPIGEAIVSYAKSKNIELIKTINFESITGKGITAKINEDFIAVGNKSLMKDFSINSINWNNKISEFSDDGKTLIFVGVNNKLEGIIAVEDQIKPNAKKVISELKNLGIKTIMITGDNKKTAEIISQKIGVDSFESEVLPNEKANAILKFQKGNNIVAMVGDGINDAPALAQSDIGIAIGSGTDIAIETGEIVLIGGDLNGVLTAIKLSKRTIKTIKQNLFWAFIYNAIGIPLAAFGLLNPMFAALAMSFSSVSVITNSLRLKNFHY